MEIKKHIQVVAALNIGLGILGLLAAAFVFALIFGIGLLSGEQEAIAILGVVATIFSGFLVVMSLPGVIAGLGLLRYQQWARMLTLIISALNLVNVPVGTLLGIYGIWVLMQDETEALFSR